MTLTEAKEREIQVSQFVEKEKQKIIKEIREQSYPSGYQKINSNCFSINFSNLGSFNLSPEFYSPDAQARLIEQYFNSTNTCTGFEEKINTAIKNKAVKISGNRQSLNDNTINILKTYIKNLKEE